ncbi:hypothetical protein ACFX2I_027903 [Malus domestica]
MEASGGPSGINRRELLESIVELSAPLLASHKRSYFGKREGKKMNQNPNQNQNQQPSDDRKHEDDAAFIDFLTSLTDHTATHTPKSLSKLRTLSLLIPTHFPREPVHTAKSFSAVHAARLHYDNHMVLEDFEGDDDAKSCFLRPFYYVEIEVPLLCNHLEEEHCFNFKNAVCPLCAANMRKDVIAHFTVHHASSFKHRRKSQKSGLWPGSLAMLGKALLENGRSYAQESAPDPLLSPCIYNISFPDPTGYPKMFVSISIPLSLAA